MSTRRSSRRKSKVKSYKDLLDNEEEDEEQPPVTSSLNGPSTEDEATGIIPPMPALAMTAETGSIEDASLVIDAVAGGMETQLTENVTNGNDATGNAKSVLTPIQKKRGRPPTRSTKRRRKPIKTEENDDADSEFELDDQTNPDEEDDDIELDDAASSQASPLLNPHESPLPDPATTPTKTPSKKRRKTASTKKRKPTRDYGPAKERTCPHCNFLFKNIPGLTYHLKNKVCQRQALKHHPAGAGTSGGSAGGTPLTRKTRGPTLKSKAGTKPFPVLKSGSSFVTPYGIVQVVNDDVASLENFQKTKITTKLSDEMHKFSRKKNRIQQRLEKRRLYDAKVSRQRRDALMTLYCLDQEAGTNVSIPRNSLDSREAVVVEEEGQEDQAVSGTTELPSNMTQMAVWKYYCNLSTPKSILTGLYSRQRDEPWSKQVDIENHPWSILGPDPLAPADSYPERMVECRWIPDQRRRVTLSKEDIEKMEAEGSTADATPSLSLPPLDIGMVSVLSGTKLYLRRNLLEQEYDTDEPVYVCKEDGQIFDSFGALKFYIESQVYGIEKEKFRKIRQERIEEVDACIGKQIEKPLQPNDILKKKDDHKPPKRKKGKQYPGHIVFDKERSSLYPEVWIVSRQDFLFFFWYNTHFDSAAGFQISRIETWE